MVVMAKKKPAAADEPKKGHKNPGALIRLHPDLWGQLDVLVRRNASDRTEEIRRAVREYLERHDLWPLDKSSD